MRNSVKNAQQLIELARGTFNTYLVEGESFRAGQHQYKYTGEFSPGDNEHDSIFRFDVHMPDKPDSDVNREVAAISIRMTTDHHGPLGGEIRPIKAAAIGLGGQSNIRTAHFVAEGTDGHTGDLTGVLSDCFHYDSVDGAYAPIGKAACYIAQVGPGMREGYTMRSRVGPAFGKQRPGYGFRVQDGDLAVLPEIACFYGHGGGNGDMWRMAASDTDGTIIANVDRLGKSLAQNYCSGHVSIADDAVATITPPNTTGFFAVFAEGTSANWSISYFRVGASPAAAAVASGAAGARTTTTLAGTTGTDGNLTVGFASDGKIYLENRSGALRTVTWIMLGRS
jgi:tetrahydromethanopterin S-methyltransferase subunit D